jgi:hypothetical protein
MQSLAVLVAILFIVSASAGPFAIAISSPRLRNAINSRSGFVWMLLDVCRKILHFLAIAVGSLIGFQLMIHSTPFVGRLFGLTAVITCYIGLRREYFTDFHLLANIGNKLGIRKIGPGDHGPKFKWKRDGRSSGNDGHGPGGQH